MELDGRALLYRPAPVIPQTGQVSDLYLGQGIPACWFGPNGEPIHFPVPQTQATGPQPTLPDTESDDSGYSTSWTSDEDEAAADLPQNSSAEDAALFRRATGTTPGPDWGPGPNTLPKKCPVKGCRVTARVLADVSLDSTSRYLPHKFVKVHHIDEQGYRWPRPFYVAPLCDIHHRQWTRLGRWSSTTVTRYTQVAVLRALEAIREGRMGIPVAARHWRVPPRHLFWRLQMGNTINVPSLGMMDAFTPCTGEEADLWGLGVVVH